MAAPADITTLDLSGIYVLNKSLSSNTEMDLILQKQGVGWFTRRAISWSTITVYIKHYKDDDGVEHIDIQQTLSGGIGGTTEERTLDWVPRTHEDNIFNAVIGKSRRIPVGDIEDEFLRQNWLPDVTKHGAINSFVESDTPKSKMTWTADQVWGFQEFDGERRYARHVKFIGSEDERVDAMMVYDYTGPNVART